MTVDPNFHRLTLHSYFDFTLADNGVTRNKLSILFKQTLLLDRNVPRKFRLEDEVKGHNMREISFAHILFATGVPGKSRRACGELHLESQMKEVQEWKKQVQGRFQV
jgi:hypothetical protein